MANPSRIPEIPIDPYPPLREFVHAALEASSFAIVAGMVLAVAFALVLFIATAGHAEPLPIPGFAACPPGTIRTAVFARCRFLGSQLVRPVTIRTAVFAFQARATPARRLCCWQANHVRRGGSPE